MRTYFNKSLSNMKMGHSGIASLLRESGLFGQRKEDSARWEKAVDIFHILDCQQHGHYLPKEALEAAFEISVNKTSKLGFELKVEIFDTR